MEAALRAVVDECRSLIRARFRDDEHHGAAAMLLDDGEIVTDTAPEAINPAVQVCHETEPFSLRSGSAGASSPRCVCTESPEAGSWS